MILRRARRLAMAGGTLPEVIKRLARKTQRSLETIRYTVKQHDRAHPESAIFRTTTGRCRKRLGRGSISSSAEGNPWRPSRVASAAARRRSSGSSTRSVRRRFLSLPLDYIGNRAVPLHPLEEDGASDLWADARSEASRPPRCGCPRVFRPTWPACTRCRS